jgi:N-acetylneuraminic acid mutarotase
MKLRSATILVGSCVVVAGCGSKPADIGSARPSPSPSLIYTSAPSIGHMRTARAHHTATLLLDGRVLVAGGAAASLSGPALATAEIYDPATDSWATTTSMQAGREFHTATLLADGRLLVLGGQTQASNMGIPDQRPLASAEIFDPHGGTWSTVKPMPHTRIGQTATLLPSGKVLVAGGTDQAADLYEPATDTWSSAGRVPTMTRPEQTATTLADGRVLLAPGFTADGMPSGPTAVYSPSTNSWATAAPMTWGRTEAVGATLLSNGDVLVVGESAAGVAVSTAEVFTPSRNTWTAVLADTPNMRYNFWATLTLPSGKGLGFAGENPTESDAPAGKIYDPMARSWSIARPLTQGRSFGFSATLLKNGRVLIAGGQSPYTDSTPMATAELYSP